MQRIVIFSYLFLITACTHVDNVETKVLNEYLIEVGKSEILTANQVFIVVPLFSGCHSCESEILSFAKSNIDLKNIFYILSMHEKNSKHFNMLKASEFANSMPINFITEFKDLAMKKDMVFTESKIYFVENGNVFKTVKLTAINIKEELIALKEYLK